MKTFFKDSLSFTTFTDFYLNKKPFPLYSEHYFLRQIYTMKVEKKMLPKSIVELTIEESAANVAKFRKEVISSASKNADIKGFRKGTPIPEDVIVRQF